MVRLETEPEPTLHLLSLLLRERLEIALGTPEGQQRARRLRGSVAFVAEGMETLLRFEGSSIHLGQSDVRRADVRASGTLASFLAICRGHAGVVSVLRRQVRVRGNPILLMKTLPLLRVFDDGAQAA